ncbi:hypothetical protein MNBD_DELTA02-50 [hydrothermal vent metagenome]|uniref:Uncharacterized protein n=1 Tax=hydrothermal vent metagenome TaxID=652676 RepID=A0A3B0VD65_9ZZZZ
MIENVLQQQQDKKDKKKVATGNVRKEHHCSVCGKLNPATICHACEDRIRAEAAEHKRDIEKK